MKRRRLTIFFALMVAAAAYSQNVGGHRGAVRALAYDQLRGHLFSAGEDGFINVWTTQAAMARYQVSPYALTGLALRPGHSQLAVIESDGLGLYRISAWDYATYKNIFSLRFKDPVSYIGYSAAGSFLIAARSAQNGVVFLDPETGNQRRALTDLAGPVSFAATGRSEKTMIAYAPQGQLSYWDLATGARLKSLTVPARLAAPQLFGNNRFFAGTAADGLVVLDAVSGAAVGTHPLSPEALAVPRSGDDIRLRTFDTGFGGVIPRDFSVHPDGTLRFLASYGASSPPMPTCALATDSGYAVGGPDGQVRYVSETGYFDRPAAASRLLVREAAVSETTLALLTDQGAALVPADYRLFKPGEALEFTSVAREYTALTPLPSLGRFILWEKGGAAPPVRLSAAGAGVLPGVPAPATLRMVDALADRTLYLDNAGKLTVVDTATGAPLFEFSTLGILDAVFSDRHTLLLARSAVGAETPLLWVDIDTGETVPGDYPAKAVVRLHRSPADTLYAAVITETAGGLKTGILRLDRRDIRASTALVEYQGEDGNPQIWDCGGAVATNLGGDGATLYGARGFQSFERRAALPKRILADAQHFILLDADGGLAWHDNRLGRTLAELRLEEDTWYLETSGTVISGPVRRRGTY